MDGSLGGFYGYYLLYGCYIESLYCHFRLRSLVGFG